MKNKNIINSYISRPNLTYSLIAKEKINFDFLIIGK